MGREGGPPLISQDPSSALVIIDVQLGMFTFRGPLYRGEEVLARIAGLLERARNARAPIFHVQHDGGLGHILAKGSAGWSLRRSRVFGQLPGENKLRPVAGCWFHLSPKSNSSCLVAGCCEACGQPPTCG